MPRGYWEAKDTNDDLDGEIKTKIARGYPLTNIVFEDTRRAVLFQNNRPACEADLKQRSQLVALLNQFFSYTGEQIEEFHAAVKEFQERIPELARGLITRIEEERAQNKRFVAAFDRAIKLNPKNAGVYLSRGRIYRELDQREQAIADFKRVLQLSTDPELQRQAKQALEDMGVTN